LITGSGSGIGKAVAVALAEKRHRVIATTHFAPESSELNRLAKEQGLSLESVVLDITNTGDRENILNYDLDVLINNAGIGETGSLSEIDIDKVRNNFEVNLFSPLELTQLALRGMMKKNSGTIIFISSLLGRVTLPFFGPYSMTKFALSSGAQMLRAELARIHSSVKIVVVEPGAYHTGFNQKMMATKFSWMDQHSYFHQIAQDLQKSEARQFSASEITKLDSIVAKIVQAAEATQPKFRYVAPWWQGQGVRVLRMLS